MKTTIRGKVDHWKSRGTERVQSQVRKIDSSMRQSPMKWAGVAAGAGLTLGLIGRFLQSRSHHRHHHHPAQVLIIDAC